MTFEQLVDMMKQYVANLNVGNNTKKVICNFKVSGAVEGDFHVYLNGSTLELNPGEHSEADLKIKCGTDSIMKMILGGDIMTDFVLGKIKVDGHLEKAMILKKLLNL